MTSSVAAGVGAAMGVASLSGGEALVGLLAAAQEESCHEQDAADEAPEEDALVAGDHSGLRGWSRVCRWGCGSR